MQSIFGLRAPSYRSEDGLAGLGVRRGTRFPNAKTFGLRGIQAKQNQEQKTPPREDGLFHPAGLGWGVKHRKLVIPTHPYLTIAPRSARPRARVGLIIFS